MWAHLGPERVSYTAMRIARKNKVFAPYLMPALENDDDVVPITIVASKEMDEKDPSTAVFGQHDDPKDDDPEEGMVKDVIGD